MPRTPAESFRLLQEHYQAARGLDVEARASYVADLRTTEPEIARRLASMLDVSDDATRHALPDITPKAAAPIRAGDVIGGFEILDTIASGGMGTVYRARQRTPRRDVALKVMKGHLASESALARFRLESEILGNLDHDGIAKVFDAGVHMRVTEVPYLAMELVDGIPISRWVRQTSPDRKTRLRLIVAVAKAVSHAHRNGIIHRDLKPANVLVTREGRPKVIDFGVARARSERIDVTTLETRQGVVIGTLAYMSPEQLSGDPGAVDTRTDVYAVGVMLYELLSGHMPIDLRGAGLLDAAARVADADVRPLGELVPSCSGDLEIIASKALAKDKSARYDSLDALAGDITRHLESRPILARPPSARDRMGKFVRRHRLAVAATAVILVTAVVAAIATALSIHRANTRLKEQIAEEERHRGIVQFFYDALTQIDTSTGFAPHEFRGFLDILSARVEDARWEDDPFAESRIRSSLGQGYLGSADHRSARPHLERALALEQAHRFASNAELEILAALARCDLASDDREPAIRRLEAIRARSVALGDIKGAARCELRISQALVNDDRDDEALEHALAGLDLARKAKDAGRSLVIDAVREAVPLALESDDEPARVDALLSRGLELARSRHGEVSLPHARLLELQAFVRHHRGETEQALAVAMRARVIASRALGADAPARFLDVTVPARILLQSRRGPEAVDLLENEIATQRRLGVHEIQLARSLGYLGLVLNFARRHEEATTMLEECVALHDTHYPRGNSLTARGKSLLISALDRSGRLEDAARLAHGTVDLLERVGATRDHANALDVLARQASARGDDDTYLRLKRRELSLREAFSGKDSSAHLNTAIEIAFHHAEHDRADEAKAILDAAIPAMMRTGGREFPGYTAYLVLRYSEFLLETDDEEGALRELRAATGLLLPLHDTDNSYLPQALRLAFDLIDELEAGDDFAEFLGTFRGRMRSSR